MTPYFADDWLTVYQGDCREVMAAMEPESVHCVVTSPPYWGLRDYGTATWIGGDAACDHLARTGRGAQNLDALGERLGTGGGHKASSDAAGNSPFRHTCGKCGAVREDAQLGLEPTPEAYVENMVAVFRSVWRVLRKDGTLWLNLGDSYAAQGGSSWPAPTNTGNVGAGHSARVNNRPLPGLKPKDLVGIPWRVAFALQADGWYLRSDVIWSKPNPMPESVTDRPTKSHEYLFLLSKSARYFYDADAVREAMAESSIQRINQPTFDKQTGGAKDYANGTNPNRSARKALENFAAGRRTPAGWNVKHDRSNLEGRYEQDPDALRPPEQAGRNLRSVWNIATAPYPGAHFATFPPKLVEPCIKAGTSGKGVCPECGAPWERESTETPEYAEFKAKMRAQNYSQVREGERGGRSNPATVPTKSITTGWHPTCAHDASTVPAVVLDPFAGSGTTGMVAQRLSRKAVLIDLNGDYLVQAMARNAQAPLGLGDDHAA